MNINSVNLHGQRSVSYFSKSQKNSLVWSNYVWNYYATKICALFILERYAAYLQYSNKNPDMVKDGHTSSYRCFSQFIWHLNVYINHLYQHICTILTKQTKPKNAVKTSAQKKKTSFMFTFIDLQRKHLLSKKYSLPTRIKG